MKPETLKALKLSIAHWKRLATGKSRTGESIYAVDCALCKLYYRWGNNCKGCPVAAKVKRYGCKGTPWTAARNTFQPRSKTSEAFKSAAGKRLEFLQSLLPKAK